MIDHGWILRSKNVWQKSGYIPRASTRDKFESNWGHVYWFTKSKKYYFEKDFEGQTQGSVWFIPTELRPKYYKFPNFPQTLARILVGRTCRKKGIVLDPFMDSGTTALVTLEMGRKFWV
jgi:DNA modification methylase